MNILCRVDIHTLLSNCLHKIYINFVLYQFSNLMLTNSVIIKYSISIFEGDLKKIEF